MIEWQETVNKAYELGSRMLGEPGSGKRLVRLAFGTQTLQVQWDKDNMLELRVSEPEVEDAESARFNLRQTKYHEVKGIIATRIGQSREELKTLLDDLLDKWQAAEGKLAN